MYSPIGLAQQAAGTQFQQGIPGTSAYENANNVHWPNSGQGAIANENWGPGQDTAFWQSLNQNQGQLDPASYSYLQAAMNSGQYSPSVIQDMLQSAIGYSQSQGDRNQAEQSLQQLKTQGATDLNNYESAGKGFFDPQISRFQGMTANNYGGIRNDAQYGAMLANQEGAINSQVNAANLQSGRDQAQRGVSDSGKAQSNARWTALGGAQAKGSLFQGLASDVQGNLQGLQQGKVDFQGDLASRRAQLNAGNVSAAQGMAGFQNPYGMQNTKTGTGTMADLNAANFGQNMANSANAAQWVFGLAGIANQGAQTGMQGLQQIGGMFHH